MALEALFVALPLLLIAALPPRVVAAGAPVTGLGGTLMLLTCAAVTLPLAKHRERQQLRTERDVH